MLIDFPGIWTECRPGVRQVLADTGRTNQRRCMLGHESYNPGSRGPANLTELRRSFLRHARVRSARRPLIGPACAWPDNVWASPRSAACLSTHPEARYARSAASPSRGSSGRSRAPRPHRPAVSRPSAGRLAMGRSLKSANSAWSSWEPTSNSPSCCGPRPRRAVDGRRLAPPSDCRDAAVGGPRLFQL